MVHMNVSDNVFHGHFPSSMGEMKNISFLDMSYNNFSGKLPRSFLTGCCSLVYLQLSHNKFTGHFLPRRTCFTFLNVVRIDNNLFTGKIEVGLLNSTYMSFLDMSNNFLTGVIPSWISEFFLLKILSLSNNFFEGTVPPSLKDLFSLSFLDLSGNRLSGALLPVYGGPSGIDSHILFLHNNNFTGPITASRILFLHDNNFTGPIPATLLERVQVLDLRNNKLSGSIPQFVNAEHISILLLRGNNLTGSIPRKLCGLSNIKLLDLSDNKLSGGIPSCLYNLSFGQREEEYMDEYVPTDVRSSIVSEYYKSNFVKEDLQTFYSVFRDIEIKFATKQRYDSYGSGEHWIGDPNESWSRRGILDYMYGMDMSNNELSGVIPTELGDLLKLRVLNLSHNFLSSSIPSSFSNLKDIESLDLSYNMLHGSIPQQLTSLTSLAMFDVSYNNLSGIIPQSKQFNTFDESSYLGNPLLCGSPTNRSCESKKSLDEADNGEEKEEENEAAIDMFVFYYSIGSSYVVAFIGVLVLMCFDCPWRRAWLRKVDAFIALAKSMLP